MATATNTANAQNTQMQQSANLLDWVSVERVLSNTPHPAALHSSDSGSTANRSCGESFAPHSQAGTAAGPCRCSNLPTLSTCRLGSPEAGPAVSSPAAAVGSPQLQRSLQSPSRPALLYQKLLQSPQGGASSCRNPKSCKSSKQVERSTPAAGGGISRLNGRAVRCRTLEKQSAAAGMQLSFTSIKWLCAFGDVVLSMHAVHAAAIQRVLHRNLSGIAGEDILACGDGFTSRNPTVCAIFCRVLWVQYLANNSTSATACTGKSL